MKEIDIKLLGGKILKWVIGIGKLVHFAVDCGVMIIRRPPRLREVIEQIYHVGVSSVGTTLSAGIFVGAIMALQINMQLRDFGAQGFLGGLSTSTTIRNVGPVLIAFLLSGFLGSIITPVSKKIPLTTITIFLGNFAFATFLTPTSLSSWGSNILTVLELICLIE